MNRRLLLLNNPGIPGTKNYAPSVFEATERYKAFFKSSLGGCWDDGEIMEMPANLDKDCQIVWLSAAIDTLNSLTDYSIIVFTGHGGAVVQGYGTVECVQLSGGNLYPINSLLATQTQVKRTVIIDACRCFTWLNESEQLDKDKAALKVLTKDLNNTDCRDYYNALISEMPIHWELIQSTQYGQVAHASQTGSVFCDSLFKVIYDKASTWNMTALGNDEHQMSKTLEDVVGDARLIMGRLGQIPQFRTNNVGTERFPLFAVKRESKLF